MPYVPPQRYKPAPMKRKARRSWWIIPIFMMLIAGTINYARPLPQARGQLSYSIPQVSTATELTWPTAGQAALAAEGYGMLATYGEQQPIATASITKVILALCVLDKLPIAAGTTGSSFTIGQRDVDLYTYYVENVGSRVPVELGQSLTEYQALEALLLPSANNIADSLVGWVFGSQANYTAYAAQYLQKNGMYATHIGTDASGYDPSTVSTASDLSKLGLVALKNSIIMDIAGRSQATFPVAGTITNYNTVLGKNGITGLKTGNNDANPGAFLFTATAQYAGQKVHLTGAVLGAADLQSALDASVALVGSAQQNFEQLKLAKRGSTVGSVSTAWGERVPLELSKDLQLIRWKGSTTTERHHLDVTARSGKAGDIQIKAGSARVISDIELARPITGPSFWWRLTRF